MASHRCEEEARSAQQLALSDWEAGRIADEFYAKVPERGISDAQVVLVLRSKTTGVWRYVHDREQPRYAFWHPRTELLVAWQPPQKGHEGQIKTSFYRVAIEDYMHTQAAVCLRRPRR